MVLAILLTAWLQSASPQFAEVDRAFVCPEAERGNDARMAALHRFFDAMTKAAPEESIADTLRYRKALLRKHHCARTLANLDAADAAVRAGAVWDQAWAPINSGAGADLFGSTTIVDPYDDPRASNELAVETYIKVVFPTPRQTDVTRIAYDALVSHDVYYCRSHRFALVENDYFLAGKPVLNDPSRPVRAGPATRYEIAPITPGSLNVAAARWACGSAGRDAGAA
jgi:hypothetical protein